VLLFPSNIILEKNGNSINDTEETIVGKEGLNIAINLDIQELILEGDSKFVTDVVIKSRGDHLQCNWKLESAIQDIQDSFFLF
jgi:hypothetical protein